MIVMPHPLECMDCEWIMPMGTHEEFDRDFMDAHFISTGHRRFVRRGTVEPPVQGEDRR